MISIGELNENKNNKVIIEAVKKLNNKSIHYLLCGVGPLEEELKKASTGYNIHFLGYRRDVQELMTAADLFVMPSKREGLSRSLMEAMASRLPCVVSDIRGNRDLISDERFGVLCGNDINSYATAIMRYFDNTLSQKSRDDLREKIEQFGFKKISHSMSNIYGNLTEGQ